MEAPPVSRVPAPPISAASINTLNILGNWLDALCTRDSPNATQMESTVFHASAIPRTSAGAYIQRFAKLTSNEETWIVALIYINRIYLTDRCPLNLLTIHRLLLACICVATKYVDDGNRYSQKYFAKIGGLPKGFTEMNRLELELLHLLSFDCFVTRIEYNAFLAAVYSASRRDGSVHTADEHFMGPLAIESIDLLEASQRSSFSEDELSESKSVKTDSSGSPSSQFDKLSLDSCIDQCTPVRTLQYAERTSNGCRSPLLRSVS